VDPNAQGNSKLLWDEEELMFEDISKPLKGKGKEKDLGKRRAYVRVVTSLGGASLNLELYCEKVRTILGQHSDHDTDLLPGSEDVLQLPDAGPDRKIQ
jgi:hypothetical protein